MTPADRLHDEWLETDGCGGYASATIATVRTRRYHGLLVVATTPPNGRRMLVNGCEAWLELDGERVPLSSHHYHPDVLHPDGARRLESFQSQPWPAWVWTLPNGGRVRHELFMPHPDSGAAAAEGGTVVLSWRLLDGGAPSRARLCVRPLISGRDVHALHFANPHFEMDETPDGDALVWRPYPGLPAIRARANGEYARTPEWFHNFRYFVDADRGYEDHEDLASPGIFTFDLSAGEALLVLDAPASAEGGGRATSTTAAAPLGTWVERARKREHERRAKFASALERAADQLVVRRGAGKTIIAGYPWFGDWGRDTFVSLRGLLLSTGRLDEARSILLEWAGMLSLGMLPNRFPDDREGAEYNSVDAALWFVVAVHEYRQAVARAERPLARADSDRLARAVEEILRGYANGSRHGIRADDDGLLDSGTTGLQLTWMDAKVGDWVVTPRIGKPVEVQALWINALAIGARDQAAWQPLLERARASFRARFWNEHLGCLFDVVDADHLPGKADESLRPNQIFAVGGLPFPVLDGERAERVVATVERALLTPFGLRTLAPGEPGYTPRYQGGPRERDAAYHQGTVWPWLLGAFVEAWLRVHGDGRERREEARARFLAPLLERFGAADGAGHVPEIFDAEAPFTPRGAPFQAWSLGEVLRVERLLARGAERVPRKRATRGAAAAASAKARSGR